MQKHHLEKCGGGGKGKSSEVRIFAVRIFTAARVQKKVLFSGIHEVTNLASSSMMLKEEESMLTTLKH